MVIHDCSVKTHKPSPRPHHIRGVVGEGDGPKGDVQKSRHPVLLQHPLLHPISTLFEPQRAFMYCDSVHVVGGMHGLYIHGRPLCNFNAIQHRRVYTKNNGSAVIPKSQMCTYNLRFSARHFARHFFVASYANACVLHDFCLISLIGGSS